MSTWINENDGVKAQGYGPGTNSPQFSILGGKYSFMAYDTGTTDVTLYTMGLDGVTQVPVDGLNSAGIDMLDLPAGNYIFVFGVDGTLASAALTRIPYHPV